MKPDKLELTVALVVLTLCVAVAATFAVNPYPPDYWLNTRDSIFVRDYGFDQYTPVAAPAYFYAAIHGVALAFGWGLEREFYFIAVLQSLLLFLSGTALYFTQRRLGLGRAGLVTSTLVVMFILSTLATQAFWSEHVTVFLTCMTLLLGVSLLVEPDASERRFTRLTLAFGLVLGALVVTRLVPLLYLPGTAVLLATTLPRRRAVRFTALAGLLVIAMIGASMTASYLRFGRFELSSSAGRHLWNAMSHSSDELLGDVPEYRTLKQHVPDIQGQFWWELPEPHTVPGLGEMPLEALLRKLTRDGIAQHPFRFLRVGLDNARTLFARCPYRIGLGEHKYNNPLGRTSKLPPLAPSIPGLEAGLAGFHKLVGAYYAALVVGVWISGILTLVAALWTRRAGDRMPIAAAVWIFAAYAFLATTYANGQIEYPDGRYNIPLLPFLALMASTTAAMLATLKPSRR